MVSTLFILIRVPAVHCQYIKVLRDPLCWEVLDTDISLQEGFPIPDDRTQKYMRSNHTAQTIKHMFQEHI